MDMMTMAMKKLDLGVIGDERNDSWKGIAIKAAALHDFLTPKSRYYSINAELAHIQLKVTVVYICFFSTLANNSSPSPLLLMLAISDMEEEGSKGSTTLGEMNSFKALDCIGQFALAASKLYCDVYPKSNDSGTLSHKEVTMSGFWLSGDKFVTCAHLLDIHADTNVDETERRLRNPSLATARVSTARVSRRRGERDVGPAYHVHLLKVCRASDLAIFVLNSEAAGSKYTSRHPVHSIDPRSLEPLSPGNTANVQDTYEFMGQEVRNDYSPKSLLGPLPHYEETFITSTRSVAFGPVMAKQGANICGSVYGSGKLTEARECNIASFFGCSGGMVCRIEKNRGAWRVRVVGLSHGESLNNSTYNSILRITVAGVEELKEPVIDPFQLEKGISGLHLWRWLDPAVAMLIGT
ncbi:hypothetical protein AYL99_06591 [Fonsecaea erecta]|uniref:Uncharacterized protein n=1 Tax=Fonsecaea erecta TaxID=1367422 RepID=A0A178ZJC7_9EURO|nr:hypothetical protein AYL99_06591 [Fonsecaea erecta]OAP59293.1 hypothetical protein AYL99_06591 [Fonsecaea erecta]